MKSLPVVTWLISGDMCEKSEVISACNPNPCQAGGTCFSVADDDYFCTCPTGREGNNCEIGMTGLLKKKQL